MAEQQLLRLIWSKISGRIPALYYYYLLYIIIHCNGEACVDNINSCHQQLYIFDSRVTLAEGELENLFPLASKL